MELIEGTKLFRYDLIEPPKSWRNDFHSSEYCKSIIDGCQKNNAGLFFFFDSKDVTKNTAQVACRKKKQDLYYLTHVSVIKNLNILDLNGCENPLLMIQKLQKVKIDILTDAYRIYSSEGYPYMSSLIDAINYNLSIGINALDRDLERIQGNTELINQHLSQSGYPFTILGQILTDYANGVEFKKTLISKGFDGYCFDESIGGHTICLLNSDHLSGPNVNFITI